MRDASRPQLCLLPANYAPTSLPIVVACPDAILGTVVIVFPSIEPSDGVVRGVSVVGVGPLLAAGVPAGDCWSPSREDSSAMHLNRPLDSVLHHSLQVPGWQCWKGNE